MWLHNKTASALSARFSSLAAAMVRYEPGKMQ
jgi:hypothetical protein